MNRHYVYRHFAADNTLLYVGITWDVIARSSRHATNSMWFKDVAYITIEEFSDSKKAFARERFLIKNESPKFNNLGLTAYTYTKEELKIRATHKCVKCRVMARILVDGDYYCGRHNPNRILVRRGPGINWDCVLPKFFHHGNEMKRWEKS